MRKDTKTFCLFYSTRSGKKKSHGEPENKFRLPCYPPSGKSTVALSWNPKNTDAVVMSL